MSGGEERSNEWKVVSYAGRRYNAFAVTSLQPSFAPSVLRSFSILTLAFFFLEGFGAMLGSTQLGSVMTFLCMCS